MTPPLARTSDEAHLFMRLRPCRCGEVEFGPSSALERLGDGWTVRYFGVCVGCGRDRAFRFRQPDEIEAPADGVWSSDPAPSELLDAGEWRWVADVYTDVPEDLAEASVEVRTVAAADLTAAAAAIDEVLKFLPADGEEVPASAFWSDRGRAMRAEDPGRFHRARLLAARDTYRRLLAEVVPAQDEEGGSHGL